MEVKNVSLFKVSKEFINVPVGAKALEIGRLMPDYSRFGGDVVQLQRWPVVHYRWQECEHYPFIMRPDEMPLQELVVCIEPELERLVAVKWEGKVADLHQQLNGCYEKLNHESTQLSRLKTVVDEWWQQPWWRRVWSALRG